MAYNRNVKKNKDGSYTYTIWAHESDRKAKNDGHDYKELTGFEIDKHFVKIRRIVGAKTRMNKKYGEEWAYEVTVGTPRNDNSYR